MWGENLIQFFPGVSITVSLKPASIYERKFAEVARIASPDQHFLAFAIFFPHRCKQFLSIPIRFGEVAEWSKAVDSKSIVRSRVPGVRIPPSPPQNRD